jgi:hypothetical protein
LSRMGGSTFIGTPIISHNVPRRRPHCGAKSIVV